MFGCMPVPIYWLTDINSDLLNDFNEEMKVNDKSLIVYLC